MDSESATPAYKNNKRLCGGIHIIPVDGHCTNGSALMVLPVPHYVDTAVTAILYKVDFSGTYNSKMLCLYGRARGLLWLSIMHSVPEQQAETFFVVLPFEDLYLARIKDFFYVYIILGAKDFFSLFSCSLG